MKYLFLVLLPILLAGCVTAGEVNYIDWNRPVEYSPSLGAEFPGAEADFSVVTEDGVKCLKESYEFKDQSAYTQINFSLGENNLSSITGISFMAKGPVGGGILFRLGDGDGECYQVNLPIEKEGFNKYTVDFAELEKGTHWGGTQNNKIDFPLSMFGIGAEKTEIVRGDFFLGPISFVTLNAKDMNDELFEMGINRLTLQLDTGRPGNLFFFGEPLKAKVIGANNIVGDFNLKIKFEYYDAYGKPIKHTVNSLSLNTKNNKTFDLPKIKGYCEIKWTATINGKYEKTGSFYYGVIPDNSKLFGGKDSYFGVNCHFNQGWSESFADIVKRVGISWVRDGEAHTGLDKAYPICKARGIQYMPCFTGMQTDSYKYIESEIAKGKSPHDKWDFSEFVSLYGNYAKQYGDYVFIYDMLNEPNNNGWMKFGGDWSGGDWVDVFTQWSQQISKAVRDNDPDAKILWEDMDNNLWSDQYLKYGAKDSDLDYISQHPYNLHRSDRLPETQGFEETNKRFFERNKEYNLNWRLIDGEVGFPSFTIDDETTATFYNEHTLDIQSAYLVRMYIMHLTSGVDRIFYYDFRSDGWQKNNPEHNFGLVLNDGNPKPAVCAYANMI
ncbi:MAG: hypothetical protein KBT47_05905, partial [Armatimonadetes bacterium]|nr:hypothetical protein [Candidatus Hippobium faecium]